MIKLLQKLDVNHNMVKATFDKLEKARVNNTV